MEDANYINKCNHYIIEDTLEIKPIIGENGHFVAKLKYPAIKSKGTTFIRTYNDQQNYINSNKDYESVVNYSNAGTGAYDVPEAGIIKEIGITNYEYVSDTEIVFGILDDDPTIDKIKNNINSFPKTIFLIDYFAVEETCPICGGTGITNDISFTGTGVLCKATKTQKLIQSVLKILLTQMGEASEDYQYGSGLDDLIGIEFNETTLLSIQKYIYDAVDYLMQIQSGQELDPEEKVTGISSVSVNVDDNNPSKINIVIGIRDGLDEEHQCILTLGVG